MFIETIPLKNRLNYELFETLLRRQSIETGSFPGEGDLFVNQLLTESI